MSSAGEDAYIPNSYADIDPLTIIPVMVLIAREYPEMWDTICVQAAVGANGWKTRFVTKLRNRQLLKQFDDDLLAALQRKEAQDAQYV